jgi:hypothetical protein
MSEVCSLFGFYSETSQVNLILVNKPIFGTQLIIYSELISKLLIFSENSHDQKLACDINIRGSLKYIGSLETVLDTARV